MKSPISHKGFTLVELMITVAVLVTIAAIAIPAYNGYVREARYGAARANMGSLRISLEDFRLDNGTYAVTTVPFDPEAQAALGWEPDGDNNLYTYSIVTAATTTYDVLVRFDGGWVRCNNRMNICCDDQNNASVVGCP